MNMIPIRTDLQEVDLISQRNLLADFQKLDIDPLRDDGAAVFGRTDEVVQQDGNVVRLVDEATHYTDFTKSLPSRRKASHIEGTADQAGYSSAKGGASPAESTQGIDMWQAVVL
jgi:hypothetical protein